MSISPAFKAMLFALLCGIIGFAFFVVITIFIAAFQACVWIWEALSIGGGPIG